MILSTLLIDIYPIIQVFLPSLSHACDRNNGMHCLPLSGTPFEIATDSPARRRRRQVAPAVSTESNEKPLPWLGMSPYQLYLLRTAQVSR